ncbi:MAG TPA: biotin-independent malonate decarboxylase subunit beta [Verrucomicrobiae bacterium]|nr:biotin-independent malonate decarboxylase subunit beta [Verrucomicrobiae bacterium]
MKTDSFAEKTARDRARSLLDAGTFRELLDPFARLESPHLPVQEIVPQSDDGVVIARGKLSDKNALVLSLEGGFQGGSVGEVNGAKIAGALELALRDAREGKRIFPVLILDTGGIRLQEANLGLLAISEIHSAMVALREFVPVIGVIAGRVGCFGGMAIAAALSTFLIGSEVGRLGLNGPEVIEQEAGTNEFDAHDRVLIWQTLGCRRRLAMGQIDLLVDDSVDAIKECIATQINLGVTKKQRGTVARTRAIAAQTQKIQDHATADLEPGDAKTSSSGRGRRWYNALMENADEHAEGKSLLVGDAQWGTETIRAISVVPNPLARFPRARQGQMGVEEGWGIARAVWDAIDSDNAAGKTERAIVAIVDVPGQAFGLHEEQLGIHLSLAAAADAHIAARESGHPVVALIVGKAISGAFLAHGLQASEILALDDNGVEVHVMSEASVSRVTRRSLGEVVALARIAPSTARDVHSFAALGGVSCLLKVNDADEPSAQSVEEVRSEILQAIRRARADAKSPRARLESPAGRASRTISLEVRRILESQWSMEL